MKPWMYTVIGALLWCACVLVIAPDISFPRSVIAMGIGSFAIQVHAYRNCQSILNVHSRNDRAKKRPKANKYLKPKLGHYQSMCQLDTRDFD